MIEYAIREFELSPIDPDLIFDMCDIPANTSHSPNDVSMLNHCFRRWPNIETTLGESPVFADIYHTHVHSVLCVRLGVL